MRIEKIKGIEDMLDWNARIVSLWFNSLTGKLITNYDYSDNEHNVSHYNMFCYSPDTFGFDKYSFKEAMDEINECDDSSAFYNILMDKGWVRVGRESTDKIWYFYHNEWNNEVKTAVNELIATLSSPGIRAYRTDGGFVDLFISDQDTKVRFGWSDIPDTTVKEVIKNLEKGGDH